MAMEFKSGDKLHLDVGTSQPRIVKFVGMAISRFAIHSSSDQRLSQKTEAAAIILDEGMEDIVPLSKLSKQSLFCKT